MHKSFSHRESQVILPEVANFMKCSSQMESGTAFIFLS